MRARGGAYGRAKAEGRRLEIRMGMAGRPAL